MRLRDAPNDFCKAGHGVVLSPIPRMFNLSSMTEIFYDKITRKRVSLGLGLVLVILIPAGLIIATIVLQWLGWIDVFTNFTEIWLFFVVLPLLTLVAGLIGHGLKKPASKILLGEQVAKPTESRRAVYGLHTFSESNAELIVRVTVADLSHLTVHYSERTDTPEHPTRPYYVVNSHTKQAYWVREEVRELDRRGAIQDVTHLGKDDLLRRLDENGIHLNPRYSEKYELC